MVRVTSCQLRSFASRELPSAKGQKTINMAVTIGCYAKNPSVMEDSTANSQLSLDYAIQSLIYTHL